MSSTNGDQDGPKKTFRPVFHTAARVEQTNRFLDAIAENLDQMAEEQLESRRQTIAGVQAWADDFCSSVADWLDDYAAERTAAAKNDSKARREDAERRRSEVRQFLSDTRERLEEMWDRDADNRNAALDAIHDAVSAAREEGFAFLKSLRAHREGTTPEPKKIKKKASRARSPKKRSTKPSSTKSATTQSDPTERSDPNGSQQGPTPPAPPNTISFTEEGVQEQKPTDATAQPKPKRRTRRRSA